MPRVNKKAVEEKLEAWAKLQAKIKKADAERNNELEPFIREHQEKTAPILAKHSGKVTPLQAKAAELETEIAALISADRDGDGNPKPVVVTSGKASAAVVKKEGARVIDVQKFFDFVKDKNAAFWACFNVLIKNAVKIIGEDKVDELSSKKTSFDVSISLNK